MQNSKSFVTQFLSKVCLIGIIEDCKSDAISLSDNSNFGKFLRIKVGLGY